MSDLLMAKGNLFCLCKAGKWGVTLKEHSLSLELSMMDSTLRTSRPATPSTLTRELISYWMTGDLRGGGEVNIISCIPIGLCFTSSWFLIHTHGHLGLKPKHLRISLWVNLTKTCPGDISPQNQQKKIIY